jgi:hypothetical protein
LSGFSTFVDLLLKKLYIYINKPIVNRLNPDAMRNILSLFFLLLCSTLFGQYPVPKFGDVEINDLKMTRYEKDTTADALILFDNGASRFDLNMDREFQFIYDRHLRIKIFKKSAFHYADFTIRLYKSGQSREVLSGIKGVTFNLVNGKVVKSKLDLDKIYDTEGKRYTERKFAFPEVKEGSIIELSYSITSDFLYDFRGWNFQYGCPALFSQYSASIPEYFVYRRSTTGYLNFDIANEKQGKRTFNIHYDAEITPGMTGGGRTSAENYNITANTTETVMAVKDVPALIPEPDVDCIENYLQSIDYELLSIQLPNQMRKDYTQTWETVNQQMLGDEDFGGLLKSDRFIADTVASICHNLPTPFAKAVSIYTYMQNWMKWNGEYRLWAPDGLKKPYSNRAGSSAEINLLLTLMLQNAGLMADAVMFSTRDNGIALAVYPTISKYNSVLARVDIEGKTYLLDAVSKYCPFGLLPPNDINGKGRVVNNLAGDWVDLAAPSKYIESKSYNLDINADGTLKGSVVEYYDGYAGLVFRNSLSLEKSTDDFFRKMQENIKGVTINQFSVSDRYDINKRVLDSLNIEIADHLDLVGDKIIFTPLLFEKVEKNPYTLEERKYPVNYTYPISRTYIFVYKLPEGFSIESLPKTVIFKLPDNAASVTYSIQSTGNQITVVYIQKINKILFLPDEYKNLKKLYDQIVMKHAEQIILKKNS